MEDWREAAGVEDLEFPAFVPPLMAAAADMMTLLRIRLPSSPSERHPIEVEGPAALLEVGSVAVRISTISTRQGVRVSGLMADGRSEGGAVRTSVSTVIALLGMAKQKKREREWVCKRRGRRDGKECRLEDGKKQNGNRKNDDTRKKERANANRIERVLSACLCLFVCPVSRREEK